VSGFGQNLELRSGKDIKQPGKVNPSLAGVQEDFARLLTDAEVGKSYQFMLEGKLPLRLGNYMVGYERLFTDEVANNMINISYARTNKKDKLFERKKEKESNIEWRYGATVQIHQKSFLKPGAFDSAAGGFQFEDINGRIQTVPKLDNINTSLDYFNIVLGGSMKYKSLMVGLSIENLLQQDVSLSKLETRKIPFTGNFILGGFLGLGEKATLFPSAVAVFSNEDIYAKASIDLSTEKWIFSSAYSTENLLQDLSASVAFKYKKTIIGLKYAHPLSTSSSGLRNDIPSFNIFLNSTIVKGVKLFKSDFAKEMKKFY
jgi:hypothetical protein